VTLFFFVGLANWLSEFSSNQTVIQRYVASRSTRQAKLAMWYSCLFSLPTWAMFVFLGTCLWVYYQHFPNPAAQAMLVGQDAAGNFVKPEGILPLFIIQEMPQGFTGLVIAGVLAAAMSTLSSCINSVSAVSIVDIYKRHIVKDRNDRHYMIVARVFGGVVTVLMVLGAIALMRSDTKTLMDTGTVTTAVTSGGLLGLYLIGFFTKLGDDRSMLPAIVFTILFTSWMTLTTFPGLLPDWLTPPIHRYYIGLLSHIIMFSIGLFVAWLLPRRQRDLHNLTVYTSDPLPEEPR
jgi:solute:Na+ symporter, SSS family